MYTHEIWETDHIIGARFFFVDDERRPLGSISIEKKTNRIMSGVAVYTTPQEYYGALTEMMRRLKHYQDTLDDRGATE